MTGPASTDVALEAKDRSELLKGAWFALALAALGVMAPAAIIYGTPSTDSAWKTTLGVTCWAALRLSLLIARGEARLYSAATWTFIYVFLGLAATLQLRLGQFPTTTPNVVSYSTDTAAVIVVVGIAAFEAGAWMARLKRSGGHGRPRRVIDKRRVEVMCVISLIACGFIVSRTGLTPYFGDRNSLGEIRSAAFGNPALAAIGAGIMLAFPLVTFHALVRLRRAARQSGDKPPLFLTTLAMGTLLLVTTNILSSPRIIFGTALLSLAVLAGAAATPQRARRLIIALVVGLALIFPTADLFRSDTGADRVSAARLDVSSLAEKGDYDAFAQISNTALFVDVLGTTHGRQAIGVALFWVPRSAWPNKPLDSGVLVAEARGYAFVNLSAPLWAEGFINGGYVGLIIMMGLAGALVTRGDQAFSRALQSGGSAAITGAILPFYMLILLRGSLLQATAGLVTLGFAAWAVSRRDNQTSPTRDQSSAADATR